MYLAKPLDISGQAFAWFLPSIINPGIFKIIQQIVSFLGLTEDWAFRSWGISGVRFSGYYGTMLDLAKLTINSRELESGTVTLDLKIL